MQINFSKKFKKQYEKADLKTKDAFDNRLKLFSRESRNPLLNNHALVGKYSRQRSINVTGDWRAIYSEIRNEAGETIIIFELLGTHSELYK